MKAKQILALARLFTEKQDAARYWDNFQGVVGSYGYDARDQTDYGYKDWFDVGRKKSLDEAFEIGRIMEDTR